MAKLRTGIVIIVILIVFSLLTAAKGEMDMSEYLSLPSREHIFGCDSLGRDLLGRCSYGLLVSFTISVTSSFMGLTIALILVFVIKNVPVLGPIVHSFVKALKTLPSIVLALFLLSFPGNGTIRLIFTLSLSAAAGMTLLFVPLLSSIDGEDYIIAERSLGMGEGKIYRKHILPSLVYVIREEFSSTVISAVITESSLSFLGLGLDPSSPTLGRLLSEGRSTALTYPHTVVFPALMLFIFGLGMLLINRALSELDTASHRSC